LPRRLGQGDLDITTLKRICDVTVVRIQHNVEDVLVNHLSEGPELNPLILLPSYDHGSVAAHLRIESLTKLSGLRGALVTKLIDQLLDGIGLTKLFGRQDTSVLSYVVVEPPLLKRLSVIVNIGQNTDCVFALFGPPECRAFTSSA
jgi:hypothetical protein